MFEEGRDHINDLIMQGIKAMAIMQDQKVKDSLIGSHIIDISVEPIKNRKTMRTLIIKTDAGIVDVGTNAYLDLSEIRVRIKSTS